MSRAYAVLGLMAALAACRPARDERSTVESLVRAVDEYRIDDALDLEVRPELEAKLLACPDHVDRPLAQMLDKMRDHLVYARSHNVRMQLLSCEPEDQQSEWHVYQTGDTYDGCRVLAPFTIEKYRIVLRVSDPPAFTEDHPEEPSNPIYLWRVGQVVYAADDPLDGELP